MGLAGTGRIRELCDGGRVAVWAGRQRVGYRSVTVRARA